MGDLDVGDLKTKLNSHASTGKQIWEAALFLVNFVFVLTLTMNAIAFAWMGWYLIGFQILGLILRLAGWRNATLSPKESEYLIKHPYKG